jgi:hypothetical protein
MDAARSIQTSAKKSTNQYVDSRQHCNLAFRSARQNPMNSVCTHQRSVVSSADSAAGYKPEDKPRLRPYWSLWVTWRTACQADLTGRMFGTHGKARFMLERAV